MVKQVTSKVIIRVLLRCRVNTASLVKEDTPVNTAMQSIRVARWAGMSKEFYEYNLKI